VAHGSSRAAFEPRSKVSRDPAPLPRTRTEPRKNQRPPSSPRPLANEQRCRGREPV